MSEQLPPYILGKSSERIALYGLEEFRVNALCLAQQAQQSLHIISPDLESPIYGDSEFYEAVKSLVIGNRHAAVRLLVNHTDKAINYGHRLVELVQRFSSFMELRRLAEEHSDFNQAFLIADGRGLLHRPHADRYEGECCYDAPREARLLNETFNNLWPHASRDPALLSLHI